MKLLFVYNANAGLAAGMMDSLHKLVSPRTYACDLCAITYGLTRMNPTWKAWLKAQAFEAVFYHRPDFRAAYPDVAVALPVILLDSAAKIETLVSADDFKNTPSVDELIALIEARLAVLSPKAPERPPSSPSHPS
jgi:hypothetical protein